MPELPEVETTRRGIEPLVCGRTVAGVSVRAAGLRWPLPPDLATLLTGQQVLAVERRAKYLLLRCTGGTLILHLGMSGHLRIVPASTPAGRHDHVDLLLDDDSVLRFHDPRRFGALLWTTDDPAIHPLLKDLGPEPFADGMDGAYLWCRSRGRRGAVKPFIMDQRIVVGVGNIYASEALFRSGLHPARPAGEIGRRSYDRLALSICDVLAEAVAAGGTTLRDFLGGDGRPGYFRIRLAVYGHAGEACAVCGQAIVATRLGGRSTYFCARCQS